MDGKKLRKLRLMKERDLTWDTWNRSCRYDCPCRSHICENNKILNLCQNILCRRLVLDLVTYLETIEVEDPVNA